MTKRNILTGSISTDKPVCSSLRSILIACAIIGLSHSAFPLNAYTSQEVTTKGKNLEKTIAEWSGAANAKSIFISASDPSHTKRVKNVFDGDNYLPNIPVTRTKINPTTQKPLLNPTTKKPETETVTEPRLAWIKDLTAIQSFIKAFAPKSDALNKAWYNIVAANRMIQEIQEAANAQKQKNIAEKMHFFETMIPVLTNMRNSLSESFKTVSGTRMWFYDTEASKGVMLATIPIISTALQRIITDYTLLKQEAQAKETPPLAKKEQDKINQEKGPYVKAVIDLFKNRNQDTSGVVSVSELKRLHPEKFVGTKKSTTQPSTPSPAAPATPVPTAPTAPVAPTAPHMPKEPAASPAQPVQEPQKPQAGRQALLEAIRQRKKEN